MSTTERRIWVDGALVPWEQATLHVMSQSAARGSLVFDVMSCHDLADGPHVFGLREHVERFVQSARLSGMVLRGDAEAYIRGVCEAVAANAGAEIVKISGYYPGVALDVLPSDTHASVAIAAFAIRDVMPGFKAVERKPLRLRIPDLRKMPPWVLSPQAKLAAGYLYSSVAKARAREEGFDEILLMDEKGDVAEGATQSFFAVIDGAVLTAPLEYVLAGVTRRAVLELARAEGMTVDERTITRRALETAQEAFLVGTAANVWAVGRIDERELPGPVPGPITARLIARIDALLAGEDADLSPRWMQKAF